ncbi:MAG: cation-translocating P-type ATPase [Gammaproteobacteria bacterium]|nr:cation-translocating P-type ATPase [Gammaproteobacteria bacterium]
MNVALNALGPVDDGALVELVTRACGQGRREVELTIPDMRCASCAGRIEDALIRLPSVDGVRLNPARHRLMLRYHPGHITIADVIDAITRAGYTPVLSPRINDDPALIAERRAQLKRLGVAGIAMMQVMMFSIALYVGAAQDMTPFYDALLKWVAAAFTTPVVFYCAAPFFTNAYTSVRELLAPGQRRLSGISMDLPVALAIGIAYIASLVATITGAGHVYYDSVTMFTFLLLGARLLEQGTRVRLARFDNWLAMLPEYVDVERAGQRISVAIGTIKAGDRVRIAAGSRVPVDGTPEPRDSLSSTRAH